MTDMERHRQLGRDVHEGRRVSVFEMSSQLQRVLPDTPHEEIHRMLHEALAWSDYRH
jgi:hypothetical protein